MWDKRINTSFYVTKSSPAIHVTFPKPQQRAGKWKTDIIFNSNVKVVPASQVSQTAFLIAKTCKNARPYRNMQRLYALGELSA